MPQIGNVVVLGDTATWTDSGMVLQDGEGLHLTVLGSVWVVASPEHNAKPEGAYLTPVPTGYNPGGVVQDPEEIGVSGVPICANLPPFCCAIALRRDGEGPPEATGGAVSDALRATLYVFYNADALRAVVGGEVGGYRVWGICNDVEGGFADNTGNFWIFMATRNEPVGDGPWETPDIPVTAWQAGG